VNVSYQGILQPIPWTNFGYMLFSPLTFSQPLTAAIQGYFDPSCDRGPLGRGISSSNVCQQFKSHYWLYWNAELADKDNK